MVTYGKLSTVRYAVAFAAQSILYDSCSGIIEELRSYSRLAEGWCYGEGGPIGEPAIRTAMQIVLLGSSKIKDISVYPGIDASIEVRFHGHNNHTLVVVVEPDTTVNSEIQVGYGFDYEVPHEAEDVDMSQILLLLDVVTLGKKWDSRAFSIPSTMYTTTADTLARPLDYLAMVRERQSSMTNVLD